MRLSDILLYLICIASGCVLGAFFCNFTYFEFKKDIDIFDLFSLLVTTGVGVWVAVRIGRVLNQQNSEKMLLVDEVKESLKIIEKLNTSIDRTSYSLRSVSQDFKEFNEHLYLLKKLFAESHCKGLDVGEIQQSLWQLRLLMTNAPVTNNNVSLSTSLAKDCKKRSMQLKQHCFSLIFKINKA